MEPLVGVEPTTYGLQDRCSTNWAKAANHSPSLFKEVRALYRKECICQNFLKNFSIVSLF